MEDDPCFLENEDVCPIIHETFQLFLNKSKFPEDVLKDLNTLNTEKWLQLEVAEKNAKEVRYFDIYHSILFIKNNVKTSIE